MLPSAITGGRAMSTPVVYLADHAGPDAVGSGHSLRDADEIAWQVIEPRER
jgi:hypothetical protein